MRNDTRRWLDEEAPRRGRCNVAAAVIGAGVVGAVASSSAASKASKSADKATAAQAAAAGESVDVAREQLQWDKDIYEREAPARERTQAAQLGFMQSQQKLAEQQGQIATDFDAYSKTTFRPLEQKIVADAQAYDTPGRRQAAIAESTADVEHSFNAANQSLNRALGRSGVSLSGGKAATLMQDQALSKAGALAGATTSATRAIETQGHARMMDAASLGRNLPSAQATAASTATQAANAGVNAGTSAVNTGLAGTSMVNAGFGGAMSGLAGAGQLYGQISNTQGRLAQLYTQEASDALSGTAKWYANYSSDKNIKKGTGKRLSGMRALQQIENTPVDEGWEYDPARGGPDEGGQRHDGPMAQQVRRTMGEAAAPGGVVIDQATMNGRMLAGMQELAKRQRRMERRLSKE